MGFGIIGAALSGAMTGGGAALQTVGKQQWEKQMNDERDAAQFERQKNLATLQSELGIKAHAANSATDTAATGERAQNALDFSIDNEDTVNGIAARKASSLADNSAEDASRNQPKTSATAVAAAAALEPAEMRRIAAVGQNAKDVAAIHSRAAMEQVAIARNRETRIVAANERVTNALKNLDNATTPEELQVAQKELLGAKDVFALMNGKNPRGDQASNAASMNVIKQLDKEIIDARNAILMIPKGDKRDSANKALEGMVANRTTLMNTAMGVAGPAATPGSFGKFLQGSAATPTPTPAAPTAANKGTLLGVPTSAPAYPPLSLEDGNAKMEELQDQLDREKDTLADIEDKQSGTAPKSRMSADIADKQRQQQIVDNLTTQLKMANMQYGRYRGGH